jgi:hypothetical protein
MAMVTQASVSKASRPGGPLHAARTKEGVDINHPNAKEWIQDHIEEKLTGKKKPHVKGHAALKKAKKWQAKDRAVLTWEDQRREGLDALAEDIAGLAHKSLKELCETFGTDERFVDWLKAIKKLEDIQEKRLKNAALEGTLCHRDLISVGIMGPIEKVFRQILTDGAKTIAVKAEAMVKAGRERVDLENWIKKQLGSYIRPAKARMKRTLRDVNEE